MFGFKLRKKRKEEEAQELTGLEPKPTAEEIKKAQSAGIAASNHANPRMWVKPVETAEEDDKKVKNGGKAKKGK